MPTKYISNRTDTGGNGTEGDPYRTDEFWANADPGDIFIFKDGTYTGATSMIDAVEASGTGVNGSAGSPITLKAETEGAVIFDAEDTNTPCNLSDFHHNI